MKCLLAWAGLLCWLGCGAGCATSPQAGRTVDVVPAKAAAVPVAVAPVEVPVAAPAQVVRIGGEDAALSGFVLPVKEAYEEENGIGLRITRCLPGEELVDLEQRTVDVVVATKSLQDLMREARRDTVTIDPASLRQVEIGKNDTVVFLNNQSRIKRLTKKQLKAIFTGRITRWKKVGGANREIVVFWNKASAENGAFIKDILDGAPISPAAVPVGSYEELRKRVTETPGAIGVAPRGFVTRGVRVPKSPMVTSSVIMVTRGEPSPAVRKLLDLLKDVQYIP